MSDNHKFISGLLLGALAGSALALYMNTEKGKQLVEELKSDAADIKDDFKAGIDTAEESLQQLLAKAKQLVSNLEEKLKEEALKTS
ncbi:MAG: YtxH domain-containing protein [Sphingobacteriia bacterium]|nr:YtxH domain-containing protein [Sphingobacteriia bacterium]